MATFSFDDLSKSFADLFGDQVLQQFNRSQVLNRMYQPDVVRTVAEEEREGDFPAHSFFIPSTPAQVNLAWDLAFV